jgi:hypothetical protein
MLKTLIKVIREEHNMGCYNLISDEITTREYRAQTFIKCKTVIIDMLPVTSGLGSSRD